jgi:hypothetical protein
MDKRDKPVSYKEVHVPHYIAQWKGWMSLHTCEGTLNVLKDSQGDHYMDWMDFITDVSQVSHYGQDPTVVMSVCHRCEMPEGNPWML